jgi:signal transduction histidine kinase
VYRNFLSSNFKLSLTSFLLFVPVSIAAVPIAFSFRENSPSILNLLFFGLFITLISGVIYWMLIKIFNRRNLFGSIYINFLILMIVGVSRGLVFFYSFEFFNIENPSPLLGRLINSTFTVVFWMGLSSLLIEMNLRFKRRYRALLAQILVLKLKEGERPDPGYAHMARDIARIQLNIKTTIQDLKPASLDSRHAENLAKALRHEIDQSLRPLSQRLWVKSLYAPPSTKIGSVIANAVTELNYPFLLSASLYAFANIVNTTQSLGLYAAVLYAFSTFVMFSIFETIRKLLIMKLFARRKLINILFVASIGLMVGVIVNWSFDLLNFHYSYHIALFTSPSLPILIAAVASIKLTLQDRESLLSLLKEKISGYKDVEYDLVSQGNAASYLHNSLQSELTALALQLDSLAQNPDPERNKYVMEKLDAFVSQSKSEDFQNFLETPQVRLDRIVNSWDGIAKVKLKIDPDIWSDSIRGSLVVSLLQEAIANAVRSGKANQIEVKGIIEGDSIVVTVFDNGAASSLSERRGIGSQWIDRIAISDWNLEQTDSGHVLRVEF